MTIKRRRSAVQKRPRISPLRYPGGKAALYSQLRSLIRANGLAGQTYVEPYAGGAGAAVSLIVTGQVSHIAINDLDPAVHAFWRTLVEDPDFLIGRVLDVALTVDEWRRQREIYVSRGGGDFRALGFATFYLNRTNRSGVMNGGPIGGLDQTGSYKIDARFNREALIERMRLISLYADQITVTSQDGVAVINTYVERDDVFIYADPPYFEKAGTLYLNAFTTSDHERLAQILNTHTEAQWLLTYDDVSEVARLYADRRRRPFALHYSAHRIQRATEVAVFSDAVQGLEEAWPEEPR